MTPDQSQVLWIFLYKDTPGRVKDCQKTLYVVSSVATPQIQKKVKMPKKGDSKPKAEAVSFLSLFIFTCCYFKMYFAMHWY